MSNALLFPGQGSQSVGMMSALSSEFPVIAATFAEASEVLGYDLWAVCETGPDDRLNSTEVTQPAMLTSGVATWRAWQACSGPAIDVMAGHSLGEYTALVCADALNFADAVQLVALRGRLMQQATPPGSGAMAAILGLDDLAVAAACAEASEGAVVSAANFNSPGQVVIAGETAAVNRACTLASEAGARRAIVLPVSVPSHCELMRGASVELAAALGEIEVRLPGIPVWHNATVTVSTTVEALRQALVQQLYLPVRWTSIIEKLVAGGTTRFAECGPGKVLAGLNRRIDRSAPAAALTDVDSLRTTIAEWGDKS